MLFLGYTDFRGHSVALREHSVAFREHPVAFREHSRYLDDVYIHLAPLLSSSLDVRRNRVTFRCPIPTAAIGIKTKAESEPPLLPKYAEAYIIIFYLSIYFIKRFYFAAPGRSLATLGKANHPWDQNTQRRTFILFILFCCLCSGWLTKPFGHINATRRHLIAYNIF
jgi:hypothetical protein